MSLPWQRVRQVNTYICLYRRLHLESHHLFDMSLPPHSSLHSKPPMQSSTSDQQNQGSRFIEHLDCEPYCAPDHLSAIDPNAATPRHAALESRSTNEHGHGVAPPISSTTEDPRRWNDELEDVDLKGEEHRGDTIPPQLSASVYVYSQPLRQGGARALAITSAPSLSQVKDIEKDLANPPSGNARTRFLCVWVSTCILTPVLCSVLLALLGAPLLNAVPARHHLPVWRLMGLAILTAILVGLAFALAAVTRAWGMTKEPRDRAQVLGVRNAFWILFQDVVGRAIWCASVLAGVAVLPIALAMFRAPRGIRAPLHIRMPQLLSTQHR